MFRLQPHQALGECERIGGTIAARLEVMGLVAQGGCLGGISLDRSAAAAAGDGEGDGADDAERAEAARGLLEQPASMGVQAEDGELAMRPLQRPVTPGQPLRSARSRSRSRSRLGSARRAPTAPGSEHLPHEMRSRPRIPRTPADGLYAEYRDNDDDVGWGAAQMGAAGGQPVYEAGYNNYYPAQPSSGRVSAGAPRGILKNASRA